MEGLRIILKGGTALPPGEDPFAITRSLPHGHVAAILGTICDTGLDQILGPEGNRPRGLVLAAGRDGFWLARWLRARGS